MSDVDPLDAFLDGLLASHADHRDVLALVAAIKDMLALRLVDEPWNAGMNDIIDEHREYQRWIACDALGVSSSKPWN